MEMKNFLFLATEKDENAEKEVSQVVNVAQSPSAVKNFPLTGVYR